LTVHEASETLRRVIAPIQRLISVAILSLWLAPAAAALGVGIHLAVEHHHPQALEHRQDIADLARLATHGHHHDLETAPDHRHLARLDGQAPSFRTRLDAVAVLPQAPSPRVAPVELASVSGSQRRGPPRAVLTANCSLLL